MKYKLETIPVWDALRESDECLLCHLMEKSEERYIAYYLGSSIMNPETRVKTNSTGFCPPHYRMLAAAAKPQPVGLMAHTHLEETKKQLEQLLGKMRDGSGSGKKGKKLVDEIHSVITQRDDGCLICDSLQNTMNRYAYTFVHLWANDPEFRAEYDRSRSVCLHHFPQVLQMAPNVLGKQQIGEFYSGLSAHFEKSLNVVLDEVHWMTQMYKSENRDKDWRGCQEAQKRAVHFEIGQARTRRDNG